jgi:SAM-dependent methyltransferase
MNTHFCPLCTKSAEQFVALGAPNRRCPTCGSLERHRFLWHFLLHNTNFLDGASKSLLHIAPEEMLEVLFRNVPGIEYLSADLFSPNAMVRMDITAIDYPDDSFDIIYCSHVLEHVQEDRKAMREFKRVLRPEGACLIQVPVYGEPTKEDPTVTSPEERLRLFGQEDHVRKYGADIEDRLVESGFEVTKLVAGDTLGEAECERMLIPIHETLFFCA